MVMDNAAALPLGIGAALALVFWLNWCWRGASWPKSVVKTGSVLALALGGALAGGAWGLTLALTLGATGDFCLSRPGERAFLAGLVSFALAHLAYIALMWGYADLSGLPPGAALLGLFGVGMAALLWPRAGALRGPVMAYIVIICAMGLVAIALPPVWRGWTWAAAVFILSDTVLALEMFVLRDGQRARRVTPFVIWPTYWIAQALFLWTAMRVGGL